MNYTYWLNELYLLAKSIISIPLLCFRLPAWYLTYDTIQFPCRSLNRYSMNVDVDIITSCCTFKCRNLVQHYNWQQFSSTMVMSSLWLGAKCPPSHLIILLLNRTKGENMIKC